MVLTGGCQSCYSNLLGEDSVVRVRGDGFYSCFSNCSEFNF